MKSQDQILKTTAGMISHAVTAVDVYEAVLYGCCYAGGAAGGFLSSDGHTDYFDIVVGTYRMRRFGAKGGPKVWDYKIPPPGGIESSAGVWVYNSGHTGWLIGLECADRPDIRALEELNILASGAIRFVRREEKRKDGRDFLTGLLRRESFFEHMRHLSKAFSRNGKPLYLLFIDLNNFKAINDTLGHKMGDRVLENVAYMLARIVAGRGTAYRYGGDEFCVLLPGISESDAVRISRQIKLNVQVSPGGIPVTASVGKVLYEPGEDADSFVERADVDMYMNKDRGKDRRAAVR